MPCPWPLTAARDAMLRAVAAACESIADACHDRLILTTGPVPHPSRVLPDDGEEDAGGCVVVPIERAERARAMRRHPAGGTP